MSLEVPLLTYLLNFLQVLNVSIEFYVLVCYGGSSPSFFWQIFIFVYLAVLQIVGILLAFQTRKVKLQGLRDSKFIAAIIYISSIVLVALALVTFSLRTYINIGTGIFAGGIFILTSIFLSLIFLPKVNYYKSFTLAKLRNTILDFQSCIKEVPHLNILMTWVQKIISGEGSIKYNMPVQNALWLVFLI